MAEKNKIYNSESLERNAKDISDMEALEVIKSYKKKYNLQDCSEDIFSRNSDGSISFITKDAKWDRIEISYKGYQISYKGAPNIANREAFKKRKSILNVIK